MLPDVKIVKEPGLGRRRPSDDAITGLCLQGVATTATATTEAWPLNETKKFRSIKQAEAFGITAEYDETNKILVHHHIDRFFKKNPGGTLYVRIVAQSVTLTQMCDKTLTHLKKLLTDGKGEIKQAGVALNPDNTYVPSLSGGLDADVISALAKAQELADDEFALHRPIDIVIEGRNYNGTSAAATDLRALLHPQVAVVIAADNDISTKDIGGNTPYEKYAAIGDVLGHISLAKVNESIGWPEKFELSNIPAGLFVNPGLSSGLHLGTYANDLDALHDKGYIIPRFHTGIAGVYWNGYPTCAPLDHDYAWGENSRTINKVAREIRKAMLSALNAPILLNEDGTMDAVIVGSLEAKADTAGLKMMQEQEISAFESYIDPSHNFILEGENFEVEFRAVPTGVGRGITGRISLVANL